MNGCESTNGVLLVFVWWRLGRSRGDGWFTVLAHDSIGERELGFRFGKEFSNWIGFSDGIYKGGWIGIRYIFR